MLGQDRLIKYTTGDCASACHSRPARPQSARHGNSLRRLLELLGKLLGNRVPVWRRPLLVARMRVRVTCAVLLLWLVRRGLLLRRHSANDAAGASRGWRSDTVSAEGCLLLHLLLLVLLLLLCLLLLCLLLSLLLLGLLLGLLLLLLLLLLRRQGRD